MKKLVCFVERNAVPFYFEGDYILKETEFFNLYCSVQYTVYFSLFG
jgi:hypothetical protein